MNRKKRVSVLSVELDDELFGQHGVDLLTHRELVDEDLQRAGHDLHPGRHGPVAVGLPRQLEREHLAALVPDVDDVVLRHAVARHVDALAVDQEVAVAHELTGGAAGPGQAGPVDHVVEPSFQDLQQVLTGLAGAPRGFLVVAAELLLHDAVGEPRLLLLLELEQVLLLLDPAAAVLAGRERAVLEVLVPTDEVGLETAGLLGDGAGVAGHA